jgi:GNAT superfamily N-acetyltransferase
MPETQPEEDLDIQVGQLARNDIEEAAAVMARAFCNSPSYNYILSRFDEPGRIDVLTFIFGRNLHLLLDRCPYACKCARLRSSENNMVTRIVATFVWTPKEFEKIDIWTMIRYGGALQLPFRLGWTGFRNLLEVIDDFDAAFAQVMESLPNQPPSNTWVTLERMTVLPEFQGKGIGSKILLATMEETGNVGLLRLATQEERNVRFYERLGFRVVAERDFGSTDINQYHSWFMVRECSKSKS